LGTSPDFWLKMQMQHDLWLEQRQPAKFKVLPFPRFEANRAPGAGSAAHGPLRAARIHGKKKALSAAAGA
jgi:hypothetical protein